jgi:hypothetical protein
MKSKYLKNVKGKVEVSKPGTVPGADPIPVEMVAVVGPGKALLDELTNAGNLARDKGLQRALKDSRVKMHLRRMAPYKSATGKKLSALQTSIDVKLIKYTGPNVKQRNIESGSLFMVDACHRIEAVKRIPSWKETLYIIIYETKSLDSAIRFAGGLDSSKSNRSKEDMIRQVFGLEKYPVKAFCHPKPCIYIQERRYFLAEGPSRFLSGLYFE